MKINLNDSIKVKLSGYGREVYSTTVKNLNGAMGKEVVKDTMPNVDKEGYSHFLLWDFINTFGPHIHQGAIDTVTEDNVIMLDDAGTQDGEGEKDSPPDFKPGPLMSLYEYPALRDHFAMAALHCFRTDVFVAPEYLAEKAYKVADAMMEVRHGNTVQQ